MKRIVMGVVITSALGVAAPTFPYNVVNAAVEVPAAAKAPAAAEAATGTETTDTAATDVKDAIDAVDANDATQANVNSYVNPRWIDAENLLVTYVTNKGEKDYIFNTKSKSKTPLLGEDVNEADAVISPDAKKVAYADENNEVYVADLESKQTTKVSGDDHAIKSELQWAPAGDKLYYLEGDKTNVVAELTISTGKIKKIVNDNVNYKSNLRVSNDGVKFLYTVTPEGKITADSISEETADKAADANIKVDTAGTETQLYVYYNGSSKPEQIAKTKDNKSFADMLPDRTVVYVSTDVENEEKLPVIKVITNNGKDTKDLVSDLGIMQSLVTGDGRLVVLAVDQSGKKAIYEINASTGEKKKLYDADDSVNQLFYSSNGKHLAVSMTGDEGDKVGVLIPGYNSYSLDDITK
jgi:Tol biopolymer transport system component